MTQRKLRELVKASNPVYTPALLLPQDEDIRSLFEEVMNRAHNPQTSTGLLDTTVERRRDMQTEEKPIQVAPTPRPPARKRWLVPALAGAATVIIAVVVAVSLLSGDDQPDVTNEAPVTTTVAPPTTVASGPEGAASLIGTTGRVTDGLSFSRPDAIHFSEDGTFQVELNGDTIDNGTYQIEGDLITFISEPPEPVWQMPDCSGDNCFIDVVYNCEGIAGQYQVIFQETTSFTLEVVNDTCAPRTLVARGLQMELLTG